MKTSVDYIYMINNYRFIVSVTILKGYALFKCFEF